jgi:alpha-L-rhamnosidase
MNSSNLRGILSSLLCAAALPLIAQTAAPAAGHTASPANGPVDLRVDNLKTPLGIDDPAPSFSWQLHDPAHGAKQTAYEVQVASRADLLRQGKADIWDSGRVSSGESLNIHYAGPAIAASTRYYWRVKVWNAANQPYPSAETAWWETGLLTQDAWHAQWIGYETPEESTVRHASATWIASPDAKTLAAEKSHEQHYAYRATVNLTQPAIFAALYATGQDTVSAWVNGIPVLKANPLPPWQQMPWKKFVRAEISGKLAAGPNSIAVEAIHYVVNPNGMVDNDAPPMIATLVVEYADGTWTSFSTNTGWKTTIHAPSGWPATQFNDSGWMDAVARTTDPNDPAFGHPWIPDSVKSLRHNFAVTSPIKSARLYSTALGAYELFLNGKRVGDQVLSPGWTDYRQHVVYQTYDVTAQLAQGQNAIGALLAPGWYSDSLEWLQQPNNYGATPPALRAQLRIEHADGSVEWINTDANWQASTSYILHSEIYDGESQDGHAILQTFGSFVNSAIADKWPHAITVDPAPVTIEAQGFQPIRAERAISAKALSQPKPGVYVYDFGQNMSGVEQLHVHGPAGTTIRMRFAEVLNADGTLYTDNLRTAKVTDYFTLSGSGEEEFTPQFTFHGFRYAELTGLPSAPAKDAVQVLVIHTDAPFTAKLTTGSAMINQLWSNIQWGQRSNFVGLPTDCPQRDERLGWMADAQVFWRAASYNMAIAPFSRKFAADMRGTQDDAHFYGIYAPGTWQPHTGSGAGWSDAGVVIPWTSWLQTGDTSIIDQNWDAMRNYIDAIASANPGYLWKNQSGTPFGDWLSPEGKTDYVLIATAYWAYDVTLMRQMALATNRTADAEKYAQLFDKIRDAFQKQFVHPDGFIPGADNSPSPFGQINNPNAKSNGGDTQTGYVLALHMNLLPDNLRAAAAKHLADKIEANHDLLGTGFLGTPYLLEELTRAGYSKLAYKLLLNTQYPSWGYMVTHGATTMWERWNGDQMRGDPSMNSYNHYAYGAVADWIYRYAAGVDTTQTGAGFHTIVLHPVFDAQLGSVSFDYDSTYGPIHSDWKIADNTATWHVTIPANTTGWLPLNADEAKNYKLGGAPITSSKQAQAASQNGQQGYALASGTYTFTVTLQ